MMAFLAFLFLIPITIQIVTQESELVRNIFIGLGCFDLLLMLIGIRKIKKEADRQNAEYQKKLEHNRILNSEGVDTTAVIDSMKCDYTIGKNGFNMHVNFDLAMEKKDGSVSRVKIGHFISQLEVPQYQPGKKLKVKYHPSDPENYNEIMGPAL